MDSPLPINYTLGRPVKCVDVLKYPSACDNVIVASHCPNACNTCGLYKCSDSEADIAHKEHNCDYLKTLVADQIS